MSWSLYVGTTYQIEYGSAGICGSDNQDALYQIFSIFDICTTASGCYDANYEVERIELQHLRSILSERGEEFEDNAEEFMEVLNEKDMTEDELLEVLNTLINDSDQRNEYVFLSWR